MWAWRNRNKKQYVSSLKDKLTPYPWSSFQTVPPELSGTHSRAIIARVGSRIGKQMSQRPFWPLSSFYFQRRDSECNWKTLPKRKGGQMLVGMIGYIGCETGLILWDSHCQTDKPDPSHKGGSTTPPAPPA